MSRPQVWEEYFDNTQLSARNRPWMPTLFVMLDNNDACDQVDTGTYLSTGFGFRQRAAK